MSTTTPSPQRSERGMSAIALAPEWKARGPTRWVPVLLLHSMSWPLAPCPPPQEPVSRSKKCTCSGISPGQGGVKMLRDCVRSYHLALVSKLMVCFSLILFSWEKDKEHRVTWRKHRVSQR